LGILGFWGLGVMGFGDLGVGRIERIKIATKYFESTLIP
jgi:hypothetical protein